MTSNRKDGDAWSTALALRVSHTQPEKRRQSTPIQVKTSVARHRLMTIKPT